MKNSLVGRTFGVAFFVVFVLAAGLHSVAAQETFRLDGVATPSPAYKTISKDGLYEFEVPSNWSEHPWGEFVAYTPDGAYFPGGSSHMTHGVYFGTTRMQNSLAQTTQVLVSGVAGANPHLRERAGYQTALLSGRQALVSNSSGNFPFTGLGEIIVLYTAILPNGDVFAISTDVPDVDYARYQPVFDHIIRSIRFKTNSTVRKLTGQSWQIVLDARDNWFDTGIALAKDQILTIEAWGQWTLGGGAPLVGPEGTGHTRSGLLLSSANLATLLGRVGGSTFAIARSYAGNCPESGTLYLSMNDLAEAFADNGGTITLRVRVESADYTRRSTTATVTGYLDVVEPIDNGCRIRIISGERLYQGLISFDRLSTIAGQRIRSYEDAVRILNGRKVVVVLTGLTYAANGLFEITFGDMGEITFVKLAGDDSTSGNLTTKTTASEIIFNLSTDILFDFNKAEIKPEAVPALLNLAQTLRNGRPGVIQLNGFTDSIGSTDYNLGLSERRATAVKLWLVKKGGIDAAKFRLNGYGEAQPVAPNANPDGTDNPAGRQRNRRVEIRIPRT